MQQTSKYQFNLVEGSDDFSPTPLNQNMEKVEEALGDMEDAIDGVMEAAYTPDNQPYVTGRYTGTDAETTITLGFRPKFVVISGMLSGSGVNSTAEWDRYFGMVDGTVLSNRLAFTDTGFIVRPQGYPYDHYPDFSEDGRTYCYIAFR